MRALLYACTTAADLGRTVLDEKLPELRRFAGIREFTVAGEFTDSIATGVGRRPGFAELCAAVAAGKGDVVIANSIADLCWDLGTGLARLNELGVGTRVSLICIRNSFDATTPTGAIRLLDALSLIAEHRRDRACDRQKIGILRSRAKETGVAFTGRPYVVLNALELKAMWEGGLSQSEMLRKLDALGRSVAKGTLSKAILNAHEAGSFDPAVRAKALQQRGGMNRGGRRPAVDHFGRERLAELWESGLSLAGIAEKLSSAAGKVSRQRVAKAVQAALDAGDLHPRDRVVRRRRSSGRRAA